MVVKLGETFRGLMMGQLEKSYGLLKAEGTDQRLRLRNARKAHVLYLIKEEIPTSTVLFGQGSCCRGKCNGPRPVLWMIGKTDKLVLRTMYGEWSRLLSRCRLQI